jgi:parvulin-like peptidyl-prolyl isomerase
MKAGSAILTLVSCLGACGPEKPPRYLDNLPPLEGLTPDPARLPASPAPGGGDQLSLVQLLVVHRDAYDLRVSTRLGRGEARLRAQALLRLARSREHSFADLARRFSNDSASSAFGGDLGVVSPGELHPDLEAAGLALGVGQVSEIIETPKGFTLLQRQEPSEAQAAEVVVSFDGAQKFTPRISRDREAARALASEIRERLIRGAAIEDEALAHSDDPTFLSGGFMPIFRRGTRQPQLEALVWALPLMGVSEVVETPTGFHVVQRFPVRRIQVRRIFVAYTPEEGEQLLGERNRAEAQARALEILERVRETPPGADFASLAALYSDGPEKTRGGEFSAFGRGQHPLPFERAAFGLRIGEVAGPIDVGNGFSLIKRIR